MSRTWLIVLALASGCVRTETIECGDRVCAPGARCDDGVCIPAGCGDGVVGGFEECDGSALGSAVDCTSLGYYVSEGLACTKQCTYDMTGCSERCGDREINGPELCDGSPPPNQSCTDYGYGIGKLACNGSCTASFTACSPVGWHVVENGVIDGVPVDNLRGLWGADDSDIWAVGFAGALIHFDGTTWSSIETGTTLDLFGVWGSSGSDVFAVGDDGIVLHYDGTVWSKTTAPTNGDELHAVWGTGPTDVYAVGGSGVLNAQHSIVVHFDGSAWTEMTVPTPDGDLWGVTGAQGVVYAVGYEGTLRKLASGVWTGTNMTCTGCAAGVDFAAAFTVGSDVYAVGENGTVVHLEGTDEWVLKPQSLTTSFLRSVWASAPDDIYLGGEGGDILHYNGAHFVKASSGAIRPIFGLWGSRRDHVFAANTSGAVLELTGLQWLEALRPAPTIIPPVELDGIWSDAMETIVVGTAGRAFHTLDGGETWTALTLDSVTTEDLVGVWADEAGHAFIATGGSLVLERTTRGGMFVATSIPSTNIARIFGTSASNVYMVGGGIANSVIRRFNGSSWSNDLTNAAGKLYSVWASGPNDVFAVGDGGQILHSSDGTTFTPQDSGTTETLVGLWGTSPTDVFAGGTTGTMLHYDGTRWRRYPLVTGDAITAIRGYGPHDVFAAGTGILLHYDGVAWSELAAPEVLNVSAIATATAGTRRTTWFAGDKGLVLALEHERSATEIRCGDTWDDDWSSLVDCDDPACHDAGTCQRGGAFTKVADLGCNETRPGTTFTGIARLDLLPCLADATLGPEAVYRFVAPSSGTVTVTLGDPTGDVSLAVTGATSATGSCDITACTAGDASNTVSFETTAGSTYYVVADSTPVGGADFMLTTSCP